MIPAGQGLRVLQIDPNANTPPYDRALCQALAAAGCQVRLLTSRFLYESLPAPRGYRLEERFFRVVGSPLARRLGVDARPRLRRVLKAAEYPLDWATLLTALASAGPRRRPDVVHVQWAVNPALDLRIWRQIQRSGLPLVYTVHNLVPHDTGPGDVERYGQLYQAADGLIVHSQQSASALARQWAIPPERIVVAPHGPLLETWPAVERGAARHQLGLSSDAELTLFCGLIEPYKGLADLIAAFGLLADHRPTARLVVAGKPNEPIGPYRQQLRSLGLIDRATLDLRFLPERDLAAYLCAADVVVLPYRTVTSSGILPAARRFGCAVVATDVGDLGELIRGGENGLLVPPADPPDLARAVERLLADPALARRIGTAGQRAAFGPHGWSEAARRTIELYRQVCHARPRSFRGDGPIR